MLVFAVSQQSTIPHALDKKKSAGAIVDARALVFC
jgi:hypothetical protein